MTTTTTTTTATKTTVTATTTCRMQAHKIENGRLPWLSNWMESSMVSECTSIWMTRKHWNVRSEDKNITAVMPKNIWSKKAIVREVARGDNTRENLQISIHKSDWQWRVRTAQPTGCALRSADQEVRMRVINRVSIRWPEMQRQIGEKTDSDLNRVFFFFCIRSDWAKYCDGTVDLQNDGILAWSSLNKILRRFQWSWSFFFICQYIFYKDGQIANRS